MLNCKVNILICVVVVSGLERAYAQFPARLVRARQTAKFFLTVSSTLGLVFGEMMMGSASPLRSNLQRSTCCNREATTELVQRLSACWCEPQ